MFQGNKGWGWTYISQSDNFAGDKANHPGEVRVIDFCVVIHPSDKICWKARVELAGLATFADT